MSRKLFCFLCLSTIWLAISPTGYSAADECPGDSVRIKASDPNPFDTFGIGVGISGDLVVVGADWDDELAFDAGAAYVFQLGARGWAEDQKLFASDGVAGDEFGNQVAVEGDTFFITALQHLDPKAPGGASVYVFRSFGSSWIETQELVASDGAFGDAFGRSLAISGHVAVIGASSDDDDGFASGAAYVFRFNPGTSAWIQEQKLTASDAMPMQGFGRPVAIEGDVIVLGAVGDDSACPDDVICDSGAAYVFRYDPEAKSWFEQQKLLASDAAWGDDFGLGVAVHGGEVLIGVPCDDDNGPTSGSVYNFRFDPETSEWVEEQKLLASDGLPGDQFGRALAMDGDLAVIGAWKADPVGNSSGAAYVFRRGPDGVWTEECKLLPEPNGTTQIFGKAIAVDCGRVIIGSKGEDTQSGAAYIYELPTNPADLNGDCDVGAFDLAQLLASWGPCPKPCTPGDPANTCPADLNADCTIGPTDLATLLGSWGT